MGGIPVNDELSIAPGCSARLHSLLSPTPSKPTYVGAHTYVAMPLMAEPDTSKANPRTTTILEILHVIQDEAANKAMPLSLAEIGRRLSAKKTRPEVIRVAVELLEAFGAVKRGSKGVVYTRAPASLTGRPTVPL